MKHNTESLSLSAQLSQQLKFGFLNYNIYKKLGKDNDRRHIQGLSFLKLNAKSEPFDMHHLQDKTMSPQNPRSLRLSWYQKLVSGPYTFSIPLGIEEADRLHTGTETKPASSTYSVKLLLRVRAFVGHEAIQGSE